MRSPRLVMVTNRRIGLSRSTPSSSIQSSKLHWPSGSSLSAARVRRSAWSITSAIRALTPCGAVALDQPLELALGDVAGGELGAQVAEHLDRHPDVLLDQGEQGLVAPARGIELERRDAQAFLIDLGRVRGVGAGDPAADVGVMADGGGKGEPLALVVERLEEEDVGQVHAALEGVVHHEDVARLDVVAIFGDHDVERGRDRPQMAGQGQPLRDQLAGGVAERGRVVHVVLEHARVGRAEHGQRHLVGDREDRVPEQLEGDRVVGRRHQGVRRNNRNRSGRGLTSS